MTHFLSTFRYFSVTELKFNSSNGQVGQKVGQVGTLAEFFSEKNLRTNLVFACNLCYVTDTCGPRDRCGDFFLNFFPPKCRLDPPFVHLPLLSVTELKFNSSNRQVGQKVGQVGTLAGKNSEKISVLVSRSADKQCLTSQRQNSTCPSPRQLYSVEWGRQNVPSENDRCPSQILRLWTRTRGANLHPPQWMGFIVLIHWMISPSVIRV